MDYQRPDKTSYFLDIARSISARSTCLRRRYGAIIVKNDTIVATGFNGAERGKKSCDELGYCYRKENNIPAGTQYERCLSVHAEANCCISGNRLDMIGATMYIAGVNVDDGSPALGRPCMMCSRMIKNAQIALVVTEQEFIDAKAL